MALFKVIDKISQKKEDFDDKFLKIHNNSIIKMSIDREDIESFFKVSNSLVVKKSDETYFILVDYFLNPNNTFIIQDVNGDYWTFDEQEMMSEGYKKFKFISDYDALFEQPNIFEKVYSKALPVALGLGAVGAGALIFNKIGNSESSTVQLDSVKVLSNNFKGLAGTGEPGATVVLIKEDSSIETTIVGSDGHWLLADKTSRNYLADGKEGKVYQVLYNGSSDTTSTGIARASNPSNPTILDNNDEKIAGTSDAKGGVIVIKGVTGKEFTTNVDENGNWEINQRQKFLDANGNYIEENICEDKKIFTIKVVDKYGNESGTVNQERNNEIKISNISFKEFNETNVIGGKEYTESKDKEKKLTISGAFDIQIPGSILDDSVRVTLSYIYYDDKDKKNKTSTLYLTKTIKESGNNVSWAFSFKANDKFFINDDPKKESSNSIFKRTLTLTVTAENSNKVAFEEKKQLDIKINPTLESTPDFISNYDVTINEPVVINNGKITNKEGFTLSGKVTSSSQQNSSEKIEKIIVKIDGNEYKYLSTNNAESNKVKYNTRDGVWSLSTDDAQSSLENGRHTIQIEVTVKNQANNSKTFSGKDYSYEVDIPNTEARSILPKFQNITDYHELGESTKDKKIFQQDELLKSIFHQNEEGLQISGNNNDYLSNLYLLNIQDNFIDDLDKNNLPLY